MKAAADQGFPGFVGTLFRQLAAYLVTCVPVGVFTLMANDHPGGEGAWPIAILHAIIASFFPYFLLRAASRTRNWDSYPVACLFGAITGVVALAIAGNGKRSAYAIYIIDVPWWAGIVIGALAGALYFRLEAIFNARGQIE